MHPRSISVFHTAFQIIVITKVCYQVTPKMAKARFPNKLFLAISVTDIINCQLFYVNNTKQNCLTPSSESNEKLRCVFFISWEKPSSETREANKNVTISHSSLAFVPYIYNSNIRVMLHHPWLTHGKVNPELSRFRCKERINPRIIFSLCLEHTPEETRVKMSCVSSFFAY